jgi:transposase
MLGKKYPVKLTEPQRHYLQKLTTTGKASARKLYRARILLLAEEASNSPKSDEQIAQLLLISPATVTRVRRRFVKEGLEAALNEKPRPGQPSKLLGKHEAHILAIAQSIPPEGRTRWTLRLIADKWVELDLVDRISHVAVGEVLKKSPQTLA